MNELFEFVTSEEMIIVGLIILTASILALIVFFIEKNYYKRKQKNNTKQIHKIVEEEQDNIVEEKEVIPITNSVEVVPVSIGTDANHPLVEVLDITKDNMETENRKEQVPLVIPIEQFNEEAALKIEPDSEVDMTERLREEPEVFLEDENQGKKSIESIYNEVKEEVEQLQYVDPEPNQEEAKEELRKATESLINQEKINHEEKIDLTKFEEEQEENAIISLDELMQKSEILYEQNETTQYQDEGNEPISLEDLEKRMQDVKVEIEKLNEDDNITISPTENTVESIENEIPTVKLDDLSTIESPSKAYREDIVFKSSPIISPIFGIEDNNNDRNLELENTANYDKLDEEIKKTNQFLATLRELQKNLE